MPGFDGIGPAGQGSMTGGGRGYCAVSVGDRGSIPFAGRRFFGRGGGRGRRNCFYAAGFQGWMRPHMAWQADGFYGSPLSKDDELLTLKNQASILKGELDAIQARVQNLEGGQEEKK